MSDASPQPLGDRPLREADPIGPDDPRAFVNRELSWLQFARRVLALAADPGLPLLERIKFAGIVGMLHDEFFMKRMAGLKRQIERGVEKRSLDGLTPEEELAACRDEVLTQVEALARLVEAELRPGLAEHGIPISEHDDLAPETVASLEETFVEQVLPVLTPLAVDAEHPFPFISNLTLNLAVVLGAGEERRFVRIKVPANRSRWVELPDGGWVPLEQLIAANLDRLFPDVAPRRAFTFRVTRGAEGDPEAVDVERTELGEAPGSIIRQVATELKARRFAGEVRLQTSEDMPADLREWLAGQLELEEEDVYVTPRLLALADLLDLEVEGRPELRLPPHQPVVHPRLRGLAADDPGAIFAEIRRGDLLLHHPYQSFDASVLRFIESAAVDPSTLAIKLTIYRTSSDSPIIRALTEAARRGKQVAVLVEITARFDEAPNIAWGKLLENEGCHVSYGVEKLKTHVKAAMVVREEGDGLRRYVHVGTGNYHSSTAKMYEDVGMLSDDPDLASDVAAVFNELTSATPFDGYRKLLVAPRSMRDRFVELIRREAERAAAGRRSGIRAKMNQLQDPQIVRELYRASRAGVPISLNVRGLCILRPGIEGLSETVRVFSTLGRFLEHGRIYRFHNDGDPVTYIGSADWMKRNLDKRVESVAPVSDPELAAEIDRILTVYEEDNTSAWDMLPDGRYRRRTPAPGEEPRPAQERFIAAAEASG